MLRHQEALVRSVECRLVCRKSATTAQMAALLRQLYPDPADSKSYIYTADDAKRGSYRAENLRYAGG